jgi:hypothetical protein
MPVAANLRRLFQLLNELVDLLATVPPLAPGRAVELKSSLIGPGAHRAACS